MSTRPSVLNVILSDKERNSVNQFFKRTIERFPILSDEKKAERFVRAGPQFIDVDRIGKSVRIEREKLEIMKRELRKHDFDVDTLLKRDWLD